MPFITRLLRPLHLRLNVVISDGGDARDGLGDVSVDDGHRRRRHSTQEPRRRQVDLE